MSAAPGLTGLSAGTVNGSPRRTTSCSTCHRRKVSCSLEVPACAACKKHAITRGEDPAQVQCTYPVSPAELAEIARRRASWDARFAYALTPPSEPATSLLATSPGSDSNTATAQNVSALNDPRLWTLGPQRRTRSTTAFIEESKKVSEQPDGPYDARPPPQSISSSPTSGGNRRTQPAGRTLPRLQVVTKGQSYDDEHNVLGRHEYSVSPESSPLPSSEDEVYAPPGPLPRKKSQTAIRVARQIKQSTHFARTPNAGTQEVGVQTEESHARHAIGTANVAHIQHAPASSYIEGNSVQSVHLAPPSNTSVDLRRAEPVLHFPTLTSPLPNIPMAMPLAMQPQTHSHPARPVQGSLSVPIHLSIQPSQTSVNMTPRPFNSYNLVARSLAAPQCPMPVSSSAFDSTPSAPDTNVTFTSVFSQRQSSMTTMQTPSALTSQPLVQPPMPALSMLQMPTYSCSTMLYEASDQHSNNDHALYEAYREGADDESVYGGGAEDQFGHGSLSDTMTSLYAPTPPPTLVDSSASGSATPYSPMSPFAEYAMHLHLAD